MPRYHFHVDDGTLLADNEGTELPDLQAARAEAVSAAGELLRDLDGALWEGDKTWIMHVTDQDDILLFTLSFSAKVSAGKAVFLPEDKRRID
ncbi:DUF6894 family protein [Mesorhizobium sp. ES1-1]|uniref:DUF6894 family protein n=1 Tax=Mesorhizobium sp. ES1-1 TaxID=2876629 RepID=UPI001CCE08C4|nr:hypothetical protein [Mesorhizobium sp. ES1-1]MBZ9676867.1 hypothetical protein [Mesorhizobium sp. ES1-1]